MEQEKLLNELLVEEGLESTMIEVYQTLLEINLKECFPSDQYQTFNTLCNNLFKESESHREAIRKIIKKHQ